MRFLKQSERSAPRLSLILLDWSVRESFHLLHYLGDQTVSRDCFEVIVIEYFATESKALLPLVSLVDSWLLLEMPSDCYYHKHLMYNAGIVEARGEIIVICDSDAMVKPSFIGAIVSAFDSDRKIVLHVDQFRNVRRDLYPFNYPAFEEVTGRGCINNVNGKTRGIAIPDDAIHNRNYGACMCALREDLIRIGGADEHVDYLGHICGPYEMTFRLVNAGLRESWLDDEFMYHTWHPGQAGEDNYLGPHDGRHVSTTALDALTAGRIFPLVENPTIGSLRTSSIPSHKPIPFQIPVSCCSDWSRKLLPTTEQMRSRAMTRRIFSPFLIAEDSEGFVAVPRVFEHRRYSGLRKNHERRSASLSSLEPSLLQDIPAALRLLFPALSAFAFTLRFLKFGTQFAVRRLSRGVRA